MPETRVEKDIRIETERKRLTLVNLAERFSRRRMDLDLLEEIRAVMMEVEQVQISFGPYALSIDLIECRAYLSEIRLRIYQELNI